MKAGILAVKLGPLPCVKFILRLIIRMVEIGEKLLGQIMSAYGCYVIREFIGALAYEAEIVAAHSCHANIRLLTVGLAARVKTITIFTHFSAKVRVVDTRLNSQFCERINRSQRWLDRNALIFSYADGALI